MASRGGKKRDVFGDPGGCCFEGSIGSLLRCSGGFRGPENGEKVFLGSYPRCLGRFGGSQSYLQGAPNSYVFRAQGNTNWSYVRCLLIFEGSMRVPSSRFKDHTRLDGFGWLGRVGKS